MKKISAITTLLVLILAAVPLPASAAGGGFCRSMGKGIAPMCRR